MVADIPGLIKGAHKGTGLGIRFLRHIERTRILIHLVDVSAMDTDNPLHAYNTVNEELAMYNKKLMEKPQIVVLNKIDLPDVLEAAKKFQAAIKEKQVILISALTGEGIENLKSKIIQLLDSLRES